MNEYERQKELALMDEKILKAKNVLVSLEETKEAYLAAREKEAAERIAEVANASRSTLDAASSRLKQVEVIGQGLENIVTELLNFQQTLIADGEKFVDDMRVVNEGIAAKIVELKALEDKIRGENQRISSEWSMINTRAKELDKLSRRVHDERLQLLAAKNEYGKRTT